MPLSAINRALNRIPKRAEQRHVDQLRHTFVDSGVSDVLEVIDHQVVYGRRGTGKTHALRYLETEVAARGDIAVYADLRTVGSPEGLFMGGAAPPTERAGRLLVDLLGQVHEALLAAVIEDETLIADTAFVNKLDQLIVAITSVRVQGGRRSGARRRAIDVRQGHGRPTGCRWPSPDCRDRSNDRDQYGKTGASSRNPPWDRADQP